MAASQSPTKKQKNLSLNASDQLVEYDNMYDEEDFVALAKEGKK